jgi:predicted DNA-binding transcriptional regulator AlpA
MPNITEHNKPSPGYTWARHGHYLDTGTLLKRVPWSRSTLDRLIGLKQFPAPARIGGKLWWSEVTIEEFMRAKTAPPVVADEDPFAGLDDAPAPAAPSLQAKIGRPRGSKNRPQTARAIPSAKVPAHPFVNARPLQSARLA